MATTDYFTLASSDLSLVKRFQVVYGGWRPTWFKSETINRTLDGKIDASRGKVWQVHEYLVRVPYEVTDQNYGTLDDLKAFFSFCNPAGTPTDQIELTDHFGVTYTALFTKEFGPDPLGILIEGPYSSYIVRCTFECIDIVETSGS